MSTVGSTFRQVGFKALLASDGEALNFRGTSLTALVDRSPDLSAEDIAELATSLLANSRVELLHSAVASTPTVGEVFYDSSSFRHRIKLVRRTAISYRCLCAVSA